MEYVYSETGIVYDAHVIQRVLGVPCDIEAPVPEIGHADMLVYYNGWFVKTLLRTRKGMRHTHFNSSWESYWTAKPGYYRLKKCFFQTSRKNWGEQCEHIRTINERLQPTPFAVAVTAVLVHISETGEDFFEGSACRCNLSPDWGAILRVDHSPLEFYEVPEKGDPEKLVLWFSRMSDSFRHEDVGALACEYVEI